MCSEPSSRAHVHVPGSTPPKRFVSKAAEEEARTLWIGGLSDILLEPSSGVTAKGAGAKDVAFDAMDTFLYALLEPYGEVVSLTGRRKQGKNKSWALAGFKDLASAEKALASAETIAETAIAHYVPSIQFTSTSKALLHLLNTPDQNHERCRVGILVCLLYCCISVSTTDIVPCVLAG